MKWHLWLLLVLLMLFFPVAFMASVVLPNEYAAQGVDGAIDCDGPIGVMILAIPSYLVYGFGALVFIFIYLKSNKWGYLAIILICCMTIIAITPNVISAIQEHSKNTSEHMETCGIGW